MSSTTTTTSTAAAVPWLRLPNGSLVYVGTGMTVGVSGADLTMTPLAATPTVTYTYPSAAAAVAALEELRAAVEPLEITPAPTTALAAPTIAAIVPATAAENAAIASVLTGTNFQPGAAVTINAVACVVTFQNAGSLAVAIAAGLPADGVYDVVYTGPDGQTVTAAGAFTVTNP